LNPHLINFGVLPVFYKEVDGVAGFWNPNRPGVVLKLSTQPLTSWGLLSHSFLA
jgi:hypothetical protein